MSWASSEVVGVLTFLLPGFVAAAIFYSLTSHPKPGAFDRVVLALIFTVVVQAIVAAFLVVGGTIRKNLQWIGNWELVCSVLVAAISRAARSSTARRLRRPRRVSVRGRRGSSRPPRWSASHSLRSSFRLLLNATRRASSTVLEARTGRSGCLHASPTLGQPADISTSAGTLDRHEHDPNQGPERCGTKPGASKGTPESLSRREGASIPRQVDPPEKGPEHERLRSNRHIRTTREPQ